MSWDYLQALMRQVFDNDQWRTDMNDIIRKLLLGTTLYIPTDFMNNEINRDRAHAIRAALTELGLVTAQQNGASCTYLDIVAIVPDT